MKRRLNMDDIPLFALFPHNSPPWEYISAWLGEMGLGIVPMCTSRGINHIQ